MRCFSGFRNVWRQSNNVASQLRSWRRTNQTESVVVRIAKSVDSRAASDAVSSSLPTSFPGSLIIYSIRLSGAFPLLYDEGSILAPPAHFILQSPFRSCWTEFVHQQKYSNSPLIEFNCINKNPRNLSQNTHSS